MKQKTIKNRIVFEGVGVHFGLPARIVLHPAEQDTGVRFTNSNFQNSELKLGTIVPESAMHASVIKNDQWMVSTVEHLMAALSAFGIDNVVIEVHGIEIPILDGSALSFAHEIERVGVQEQGATKQFLTPKELLEIKDKAGRSISIIPAAYDQDHDAFDVTLSFDYTADFKHPLIRSSQLTGTVTKEYFVEHIAPARTFGFLEQLPFLRKHGLAKGTTLGNTVVIGEEEFLNDLRFEDEFVRHKTLDLIGDLALLGKNLAGKIVAYKTGHNFNRLVVEHYIKQPELWKTIA